MSGQPDIKAIAEGLTEAQKRALTAASRASFAGQWHIPVYRDMGRLAASLALLGVTMKSQPTRLTQIGRAVRRALLESREG